MLDRCLLIFVLIILSFNSFSQNESIWFYPNEGQWDQNVLYKTPLAIGDFYIDKEGFTYNLFEKNPNEHPGSNDNQKRNASTINNESLGIDAITTKFINASFNDKKHSISSKHYHNYFIGKDSTKWKGNIFGYHQLEIQNIYPEISLLVEAKNKHIEYSFIVNPHKDPSIIQMKIDGDKKSFIDDLGDLHIQYRYGEIINRKPIAWSMNPVNGHKTNVEISFEIHQSIVTYKIGKYNKNHILVIDPEIVFSSFSGSIADNRGFTATPDRDGNLIAGGVSFGIGYPTVSGSYNLKFNGGDSVYIDSLNTVYSLTHSAVDLTISKFNATGKDLLFSTYIGGTGNETPHSMVCDAQNNLYIFGATSSSDFPIPSKSYDNTFNGGKLPEQRLNIYFNKTDLYVLKLNDLGSILKSATYIGGSKNDGINDSILRYNSGDEFRGEIIISHDNNVVISSTTHSSDFPVLHAFQSDLKGFQDAVVFKLSQDLDKLIWSSYFGGNNIETGNSVQSADDGTLYLTGGTNSSEITFSNGNKKQYSGGLSDGYIIKLSSGKPTILSGTFIGATEYDQSFFVQLDVNKNVYVYGQSESNLPISSGKYGVANSGQFISKFSNDLKSISWSTVFGTGSGFSDISPTAFSVSVCGDIYLSGWGGIKNRTFSKAVNSTTIGLQVTEDAFQSETNGNNFYIAVLGDDGNKLTYATFMGGMSVANNHVDGGTSRFDKRGGIYHAVCAGCGSVQDGFSTTPGVFSPTNNATNGGCNIAAFEFDLKSSLAKVQTNDSAGCLNGDVHFTNMSVNCDTYQWDFGDGEKSTLKDPIHKYKSIGKYIVKLIATNSKSTCLIPDTTEIEVNVYDDYEKITKPVISICQSTEVEINVLEGGTYKWKPSELFSDITESKLKTTITKDVDIEVHIEKGCRTLDILYPYKISKSNQNTNNSYEVCEGKSVELISSGGLDYSWSPSIYLNATTGNKVTCTPFDSITYLVTKTISTSCKIIDTIKVKTIKNSKTFFNSPSINFCYNESKELNLSNGETLSFSPLTGVTKVNSLKYILKPLINTDYTIIYTNSCGTKNEKISVNILSPKMYVDKDTNICLNDKAFISCRGGIIYNWINPQDIYFLKLDRSEASVSPKKSTSYKVVCIDTNHCVDTNTVFIGVHERSNLKTEYQYLANWGDKITLNAEVDSKNKGHFTWKPAELLSCSNCQTPSLYPDRDLQFTVIHVDSNHCIDSSKVLIKFQSDLYIPNTFTPNNDHHNDYFRPVGYNIPNFTMNIYNRWGELIITLTNMNDFWDGTYLGKPSPDGIYNWHVYYINSFGEEISKRGHVSLLR